MNRPASFNHLPIEHEATLSPPCRTVLADFYRSFLFSQGQTELQSELFSKLSRYYGAYMTPDDQAEILNGHDALTPKLKYLRIPTNHLPVPAGVTTFDTFENELYTFGDYLRWHMNTIPESTLNMRIGIEPVATALSIGIRIVQRDLKYQKVNRLIVKGSADPHHSHFRTHVVLTEPTGSAAYNTLFDEIRQLEAADSLGFAYQTDLAKLAMAWEHNHAGSKQTFFATGS